MEDAETMRGTRQLDHMRQCIADVLARDVPYVSTSDVLTAPYSMRSAGGYAIFDDYQNLADCRRAIDGFRRGHGITEEIRKVDERAVYWQKAR